MTFMGEGPTDLSNNLTMALMQFRLDSNLVTDKTRVEGGSLSHYGWRGVK